MRTKTKAAKATAASKTSTATATATRTSKARDTPATRSGTNTPATPAKATSEATAKRPPATSKPTRAEREKFVRHVARMKGMNEEELIAAVILDDEPEDVDAPAQISIRDFTVSEQWVEITVAIPATMAAFLAGRSEHVRANYGRDVATFTFAAKRDGGEYYAAQIARHGDCTEEPPPEIKIVMTLHSWQSVEELAAAHQCTEAAIVRAGLAQRVLEIIDFDNPNGQAKREEKQLAALLNRYHQAREPQRAARKA